jgi:hypothetical protein
LGPLLAAAFAEDLSSVPFFVSLQSLRCSIDRSINEYEWYTGTIYMTSIGDPVTIKRRRSDETGVPIGVTPPLVNFCTLRTGPCAWFQEPPDGTAADIEAFGNLAFADTLFEEPLNLRAVAGDCLRSAMGSPFFARLGDSSFNAVAENIP